MQERRALTEILHGPKWRKHVNQLLFRDLAWGEVANAQRRGRHGGYGPRFDVQRLSGALQWRLQVQRLLKVFRRVERDVRSAEKNSKPRTP